MKPYTEEQFEKVYAYAYFHGQVEMIVKLWEDGCNSPERTQQLLKNAIATLEEKQKEHNV